MPFVLRVVEPKYLSRTSLRDETGQLLVTDSELEAVANNTLSNALRQLGSLLFVANDIFTELTENLRQLAERSTRLKQKIAIVEEKVTKYDPKKVPVPESDINTFAQLQNHYVGKHEFETGLFTASSRSNAVQALYDAAAKTPIHAMRQMDRWRRDGHRSSKFFLCTPVLGAKRRKIKNVTVDIDIETRLPAVVNGLRRWTSAEALGDITVTTDCVSRIGPNATTTPVDAVDVATPTSDDEGIDHKLPSPEEQLQVVALKFPAEVVAVDVSGRRFDRMCNARRSMLHASTFNAQEGEDTVRRRGRTRKPRGKRRNTLAGTDQKEIRDALTAGIDDDAGCAIDDLALMDLCPVPRSKSSDLLESKKESPPDAKKSHFNSLKQWGMSRLRAMNRSFESKVSESVKSEDIDDVNIYETITMRRRKNSERERKLLNDRKSYSSERSGVSLPITTPITAALNLAVKLRESSAQRRQRRNANSKEEPYSSSGNWSASSESGRTSIGSEITGQPKSTTSVGTSSQTLSQNTASSSVPSRRRFNNGNNINTSASSSVTSEGTMTPDIIQDFHDDGETSSVYSCDTEGYYTSFHMDSGLKTLKEEDLAMPATPLHSTSAFSNSSSSNTVLTAENEYELFGKGSTSTTTSSAGTVCTMMAAESTRSLTIGPAVPERKSSLSKSANSSLERDNPDKTGTVKRSPLTNKATVVAVVHKQSAKGDESPDSGHNTSSSPIESTSSPNGIRSGSEFEFSESSDIEGVDRVERIKVKTTINSSRIPSMCVITPSNSDDESIKSGQHYYPEARKMVSEKNEQNLKSLGSKNDTRSKLELALAKPTETDLDTLSFADDEPDAVTPTPTTVQVINVNPTTGYATVETLEKNAVVSHTIRAPSPSGGSVIVKEPKPKPMQPIIKASLLTFNSMLERIKLNVPNLKTKDKKVHPKEPERGVQQFLDTGEYVTISDVRNNNQKGPLSPPKYSSEPVETHVAPVRESEYISLNDLPKLHSEESQSGTTADSLERRRRQGARVTLDAEGKVVYSSDSLRRRKGAHTTFEPGPFVKDPDTTPTPSPLPDHRSLKVIRPVVNNQEVKFAVGESAQSRVIIRANQPVDFGSARPPNTIVAPSAVRSLSPKPANTAAPAAGRGAYVNVQEGAARTATSPARKPERALSPSELHLQFRSHPDRLNGPHPSSFGMRSQGYALASPEPRYMPRYPCDGVQMGSPVYRTLPSRKPHLAAPDAGTARSLTPELGHFAYYQQPEERYALSGHYTRHQDLEPNYGCEVAYQPAEYYQYSSLHYPAYRSPPAYQNLQQVRSPVSSYPQQHNPFPSSIPVSPLRKVQNTSAPLEHSDSLKISPIDPRNEGAFQSSTPSSKTKAAANLSDRLMSPKKSTMSNEELYAAIHKSKKKLNIREEDGPTASPEVKAAPPKAPESGYIGESRSRSSWSPGNDGLTHAQNSPNSRLSWACSDRKGPQQTSRMDFKRLLLQHSSKSSIVTGHSGKLSAVEQLKLSKQQQPTAKTADMDILELSRSPKSFANRKLVGSSPGSPKSITSSSISTDKRQAPKLMSPRSGWRFANPRTDVLSSTIPEDCREDETSTSSSDKSKSSRSIGDVKAPAVSRSNSSSSNDAPNISPGSMSRADYLKAQREQFFNTPPSPPTSSSRPAFNFEQIHQRFKSRGSPTSENPPLLAAGSALETSF